MAVLLKRKIISLLLFIEILEAGNYLCMCVYIYMYIYFSVIQFESLSSCTVDGLS